MTVGQMIFYGGIAFIVVGCVMIFLCVPFFSKQRKGLEKRIQDEYT